MGIIQNEELLEKKELRESVIDRIEILDKVGDLLMLGNSDYATTNQVADYYEVGKEAIQSLIKDNREELISNGFRLYKKSEILNVLEGQLEISIPNRGMNLFSKRTILNVGMLLRDSEVAKEIRTRLLDIIHDTQESNPEIIENVVNEINEEKQLMLDRVEAEIKGDYDNVSIINAKLFALKNKRIKELEDKVETITTHQLTLTESRNVINKLVRTIGFKEYGLPKNAYIELYKILNYKLGINIKSRNKKKSESYLHTLNEDEMFKTEKIVRNWANKLGIDVEKAISLSI